MAKTFKLGDHVSWNSEAGRVRGIVLKKAISDFMFKGYVHHASRSEPQYLIRSDKTDHIAVHKPQALTRLRTPAPGSQSTGGNKDRLEKRGSELKRKAVQVMIAPPYGVDPLLASKVPKRLYLDSKKDSSDRAGCRAVAGYRRAH